jgi:hypothetical protein
MPRTKKVRSSSGRQKVGLPSPDTVVSRLVLIPQRRAKAVPAGIRVSGVPQPAYEIIRTNQVDPYEEKPASDHAVLAAPQVMAKAGDSFQGTSRRRAKLAIANASTETFDDVKDLIASFAAEKSMINHKPKIGRGKDSDRVAEEKRNVRVRAWINASSREADNDFHLIDGRGPSKPPMFMTMEVSGLPPKSAASRVKIERARNAYKKFFTELPGVGYDFYNPPVPVEIGGSLFFDITHSSGGRPGPKDLRKHMPVIWEVHPVTNLVFEP